MSQEVKRVCPSLECPFATQWLLPGSFSVLFRRGIRGTGLPPLGYAQKDPRTKQRRKEQREESELKGKERFIPLDPVSLFLFSTRSFQETAFKKRDHRAQRLMWPQRWQILRRLASSDRTRNARPDRPQ